MNYLKLNFKYIAYTAIALIGLSIVAFMFDNPQVVLSSVEVSNEYNATTTSDGVAGTMQPLRSVTGGSSCVLGSIVIASSTSASALTVKNATSTSDVASTTIAVIGAEATEGTYTFDVLCDRGLILETGATFDGTFYTTYR